MCATAHVSDEPPTTRISTHLFIFPRKQHKRFRANEQEIEDSPLFFRLYFWGSFLFWVEASFLHVIVHIVGIIESTATIVG